MARFYRLDEANDRLAELRPLLEKLRADRQEVARLQQKIVKARGTNGSAEHAEELAAIEHAMRALVRRMEKAVDQIDGWGVALRDILTGLVDFPALANGRPIWLCWRLGEGDITWWHEQDRGFDDRRRLTELE